MNEDGDGVGDEVFLMVEQEKQEDDVDGSADIYVLMDGRQPWNSADITYQVSPTTIHANHLSFSSHSRRLICDVL